MDKCEHIALTASCAWAIVGDVHRRSFDVFPIDEPLDAFEASLVEQSLIGVCGLVNGAPASAFRIILDDEAIATISAKVAVVMAPQIDIGLAVNARLLRRVEDGIFGAYMHKVVALPDPRT